MIEVADIFGSIIMSRLMRPLGLFLFDIFHGSQKFFLVAQLQVVDRAVQAFLGEQLFVRAALDDLTLVHDQDQIGPAHG